MSIFIEEQTEACFRMAVPVVTSVEIGAFVVLFIAFICIPSISKSLGTILDTLPMRFAAVLVVLAVLPHDRFIALGLFLVVAGLYIQRHDDDLRSVFDSIPTSDGYTRFPVNTIQDPAAMKVLHHGGHAEESHDMMDFMPKSSSQDNDVEDHSSSSIDSKSVLPTEPLGSKSQNLFGEDMLNAEKLQQWTKDGSV